MPLFRPRSNNDDDDVRRRNKCEPDKLKSYFQRHFNPVMGLCDPLELNEAPEFLLELQNIKLSNVSI